MCACVLLAGEEREQQRRRRRRPAARAETRQAPRARRAADPQRILVAHDQRRLHRACRFSDDGIGRRRSGRPTARPARRVAPRFPPILRPGIDSDTIARDNRPSSQTPTARAIAGDFRGQSPDRARVVASALAALHPGEDASTFRVDWPVTHDQEWVVTAKECRQCHQPCLRNARAPRCMRSVTAVSESPPHVHEPQE